MISFIPAFLLNKCTVNFNFTKIYTDVLGVFCLLIGRHSDKWTNYFYIKADALLALSLYLSHYNFRILILGRLAVIAKRAKGISYTAALTTLPLTNCVRCEYWFGTLSLEKSKGSCHLLS